MRVLNYFVLAGLVWGLGSLSEVWAEPAQISQVEQKWKKLFTPCPHDYPALRRQLLEFENYFTAFLDQASDKEKQKIYLSSRLGSDLLRILKPYSIPGQFRLRGIDQACGAAGVDFFSALKSDSPTKVGEELNDWLICVENQNRQLPPVMKKLKECVPDALKQNEKSQKK